MSRQLDTDIPNIVDVPFEPQATSTLKDEALSASSKENLPLNSNRAGKSPRDSLFVPLAIRRSLFLPGSALMEQKEASLRSALEIVRPNDPLVRRYLSEDDEFELLGELNLLERSLEGNPDGHRALSKEPMYSVNPVHFERLIDALEIRRNNLNRALEQRGVDPLNLPSWGPDGEPDTAWDKQLFEEFAVLWREDVENFLAYCLHPGEVPREGTAFRGSRRQVRRRQDEAAMAAAMLQDESTAHMAVHRPILRARPSDMRQPRLSNPATNSNRTPLGSRNTPPHLVDSPATARVEARGDVRELREGLAATRVPAARRSLPNEMPHERLGNTRRLAEIFEDPPYLVEQARNTPHSARSLTWHIGQTPGQDEYDTEVEDANDSPTWARAGVHYARDNARTSPAHRGRGGFGARRSLTRQETYFEDSPVARASEASTRIAVPHFDTRLKADQIEEWDGNPETILDWFDSINVLASRSPVIFTQLGELVPTRLRKKAKTWWTSLPLSRRRDAMENWSSLRRTIAQYYMSRRWFDRRKLQAKECRYRDSDAPGESPSEYFIRKFKLLETAEDYTESVTIMAIMDGAPRFWHSIIDTSTLRDTADLQDKIQYHEDALRHSSEERSKDYKSLARRVRELETNSRNSTPARRYPLPVARTRKVTIEEEASEDEKTASSNLTGWSKDLEPPAFPRDDSVRSKGKTPEDKGARPCRYCGSPKHWDNDCKHARQGIRKARANAAQVSNDYQQALDDYEALYCASEENESSGEDLN